MTRPQWSPQKIVSDRLPRSERTRLLGNHSCESKLVISYFSELDRYEFAERGLVISSYIERISMERRTHKRIYTPDDGNKAALRIFTIEKI